MEIKQLFIIFTLVINKYLLEYKDKRNINPIHMTDHNNSFFNRNLPLMKRTKFHFFLKYAVNN